MSSWQCCTAQISYLHSALILQGRRRSSNGGGGELSADLMAGDRSFGMSHELQGLESPEQHKGG